MFILKCPVSAWKMSNRQQQQRNEFIRAPPFRIIFADLAVLYVYTPTYQIYVYMSTI